jgi:hypothetical protein
MKLEETIRILFDLGVEFVVIGGAAMGLQGSAHLTRDIDFCYAHTPKNAERLAKALEPFHPVLRGGPPGLPFRFDAKTIVNGLNFTLSTDLGDLDFLGEVSGLASFQEVLEGLIKSKIAAGRARDLYVLPELRGLNEFKKKTGLE